MNRTYTREWYLGRVNKIKEIMPDCAISSDIIAGFCTEEEQDHLDTLDIMRKTAYEYSYMFAYSERPGTLAARRYKDDVPDETKKRRLDEIVQLQNHLSLESNKRDIGKVFEVLIEGDSKRSKTQWMGRNSQYKVMVFDKTDPKQQPGSYVHVMALECTQGTIIGKIVEQPELIEV
jgi:tRNA-2-methylthio-N6-dimethylallyladenosine synthase